MNLGFDERVAVVTGGSSGIGLASVELLLGEGAKVAFCARNRERLRQAEDELRARYPGAALLAQPCDVLDAEQVRSFAAAVEARFGATDALINNAGQGRVSTFADTSDEAWREELALKFFGVIYPTRAVHGLLARSDQAAVVCVNSLLALQPEPHMVATSAARAGLLNLVRSLATEFAPQGIRVNSILLGLVESGQWRRRHAEQAAPGQSWEDWSRDLARDKNIPLRRLGKPREAASAIAFLASPRSAYTTGSHIDISGGLARHV